MNQPAVNHPNDRFAFGKNWQSFLATVDEDRIAKSIASLVSRLQLARLDGMTFLDIGSGSGLSSLAAHRLGARVTSIDFDPQSVACTAELRRREGPDTANWEVHQGSVLDKDSMQSWGNFDVVYAWGVLHHTGNLSLAIDQAAQRVAEGGFLFLAIYNDQGGGSRRWLAIKKFYHRLPHPLRPIWVAVVATWYETKFAILRLLRGKSPLPFADWSAKRADRGMSVWHDWVDWVGGMPFEVAKPEQIIVPLRKQGFVLENLSTVGSGWGCNEYVFRRLH